MALESNPNVVSLNAVSLPWRYTMVRARINYVPYRSGVARFTQKYLFICERGDRSATLGVRGSWNHFVAASSFSSRRNGLLVFLADRGRTRPETEKKAGKNESPVTTGRSSNEDAQRGIIT